MTSSGLRENVIFTNIILATDGTDGYVKGYSINQTQNHHNNHPVNNKRKEHLHGDPIHQRV